MWRKVLIAMGFDKNDIANMPEDLKRDIIAQGGKKVDTELEEVSLDPVNKPKYTGKSIKEVKDKASKTDEVINKNAFGIASVNQNGWDKFDSWHDFYGQTFLTYIGSDGSEHKYNAYVKYKWDKEPTWLKTDTMGVWWSTKGEKWTYNQNSYASLTTYHGGVYSQKTTYDNTDIYGSSWTIDMYQGYNTDYMEGFGRQEIRFPDSASDTTANIKGGYFHSHYTTADAIGFSIYGISWKASNGDKWEWVESFKIEK